MRPETGATQINAREGHRLRRVGKLLWDDRL